MNSVIKEISATIVSVDVSESGPTRGYSLTVMTHEPEPREVILTSEDLSLVDSPWCIKQAPITLAEMNGEILGFFPEVS